MRVALVNPNWDFAGSIYFGCREPHLPLEFGYAAALLAAASHDAVIIDAQAEALEDAALRDRVAAFAPDMLVVCTAPSYLFWRCAPPELRVPLPALQWPTATLTRHTHHHHRFDASPAVPGAEMEASRGCPYHCTFCAKENFRDRYRRKPLATILAELDGLIAAGVGYVYFIDEI